MGQEIFEYDDPREDIWDDYNLGYVAYLSGDRYEQSQNLAWRTGWNDAFAEEWHGE